MTTLLLTHPSSLLHDVGEGHPERPDRIRAIERALEAEKFQALARDLAPKATAEQITRVHPAAYLEALLEASPQSGFIQLDADTTMMAHTMDAALHAVGGAVRAVDEVMQGHVRNAFVATRPPGHHAEISTPMGFCYLNQVAIAARHAQAVYGIKKVAIMDFDVHHGNGTQDIFWEDASVIYASTHQFPHYPGTGAAEERGRFGTIVNAPLKAGDSGTEFRAAMREIILPAIQEFAPELVLISAGFDAHIRDPLGQLELTEDDFVWATRELLAIARASAQGRVVSILEGGYDLEGLSRSVAAHVHALMCEV